MDINTLMESFSDDDDYDCQPLNTPPSCHFFDVTDVSFNSSYQSRSDHPTDPLEQPNASEMTDEDDRPTDQSNDSQSLSPDFDYMFDEKHTSSSSTLSRSKSCTEPMNWPPSHSSANDEPLDLDELIIQDIASRKIGIPKLHAFLRLLLDNDNYASYASWLDKSHGLFRIHKPTQVANLWRRIKTRKMSSSWDYDSFARSIRYYYKPGIMCKTNTRFTYRFAHV